MKTPNQAQGYLTCLEKSLLTINEYLETDTIEPGHFNLLLSVPAPYR